MSAEGPVSARARVQQLLARAATTIRRVVGGEEVDFELVAPADLDEAQVGYALTPEGDPLTGGEGAWRPEWLVMGYDVELGDPLFVDLSTDNFPVYTAAHGTGVWEPERVADSLELFLLHGR